MKIKYEKEIIEYLELPSIPKKEWDGKSPFPKSVAVVQLRSGDEAYAVAKYNPEKESAPRVVKVFGLEAFTKINKVFIVPNYMLTDIEKMDLDIDSKKKAKEILDEAKELEKEGVEDIKEPEYEYIFEHIHSDEEAMAFIAAYNKRNHIRGSVPKKHENIIMRLMAINANYKKHSK